MSYPKGKQDRTCYSYEPWHYRYFGRDLAANIHDAGLTTREYLWSHYTTVDPKTGQPVSTPSPAPSGSSVASLTPEVTPAAPATAAPEPTPTSSAPEASGVPTLPPAAPAGTWFGLDPPVLVVLVAVLVLASAVAARGRSRRPTRR
jgi:D-alanyl-D-alanine carboxypeptidase